MMPQMMDVVEKSKSKIEERAIENTLKNIEPIIKDRIEESKNTEVRDMNEILAKRDGFKKKRDESFEPEEKLKYEHFITVMEWMIKDHGHQL